MGFLMWSLFGFLFVVLAIVLNVLYLKPPERLIFYAVGLIVAGPLVWLSLGLFYASLKYRNRRLDRVYLRK